MQVHPYSEHLPKFKNAVITIGTFDGVHLGHREIISLLKEEAQACNGETVIITFHPHPRSILKQGNTEVKLINTIDERIRLLDNLGVDHTVIVPFTDDFSRQTATEYIEHFLVERFHPHTVIIGYDHRFGNARQGDYHLMEAYSEGGAFRLREIPARVINDSTVSSTRIREAISEGKVEAASALLGYRFFFSGVVVEGKRLGNTIGFPTANIEIPEKEKLFPARGVYAVVATIRGRSGQLEGMMNIGVRPTVDGTTEKIEVHLFDFNEDIYGSIVEVQVVARLRDEQKFENLDALKTQLSNDLIAARSVLAL